MIPNIWKSKNNFPNHQPDELPSNVSPKPSHPILMPGPLSQPFIVPKELQGFCPYPATAMRREKTHPLTIPWGTGNWGTNLQAEAVPSWKC